MGLKNEYAHIHGVIGRGFSCHVSPMLPCPETVKACNLETKQEVSILTGKDIDCIQMGDKLFMTQKVYDTIKNHDL